MPVKQPLAVQLEELLNPAVRDVDPEDLYLDDTRAQLLDAESDDNDPCDVGVSSRLALTRASAIRPLAELGPQYRGCTVNRRDLDSDRSDSDDADSQTEDDSNQNNDDGDDDSQHDSESDRESDEDDLQTNVDVSDYSSADDSGINGDSSTSVNTQSGANAPVKTDDSDRAEGTVPGGEARQSCDDVTKGDAIKTQMNIWDQLLECRIRLQSAMNGLQQLPRPDNWKHFWQSSDQKCQTTTKLNDQLDSVRTEASRMLQQLYLLEVKLMSVFPDTLDLSRQLDSSSAQSDHKTDSTDSNIVDPSTPSRGKRRSIADSAERAVLKRRRAVYIGFRDAAVQQWDDRVRSLARGSGSGAAERKLAAFAAFQPSSVLQQVEQLMADRQRLVQRTRTRRSQLHELGQQLPSDGGDGDTAGSNPAQADVQYDSELFDDSDFYQHLLRELIERKTASVTDPHTLGRHWVGAEKLRHNVKKKVDTRASKGRKIRYEVYPKLVNFMAASADTCDEQTHLARASVIASLFGRRCNSARDPADVVNSMVSQSMT